ncbi:MAG TPA: hypothetical protein VH539_19275 [Gemmatimonadaceae bacterium]|jgi:hypothetical protein
MKPNFSGDYVLNRSASVLGPAANAIVTARIRLTHDEPRFCCSARFVSDDNAMEFTFERFTDGRATAVSDHETSRCYWDGDALVSEDRFGTAEAAVAMTWRYDLFGDGRHLRATEQIRGGGRDQDNVWAFERQ